MNENPFSPQAQEQRLAADMCHDERVNRLRMQLKIGILAIAFGGAAFVNGFQDVVPDSTPEAPEVIEQSSSHTTAALELIGKLGLGGFVASMGVVVGRDAYRRLENYGE